MKSDKNSFRYRWELLLLIPLMDILVLVKLASKIGIGLTIIIALITAFIGLLLVRSEGSHMVREIVKKIENGENPGGQILDGVFILIAGVFLLTPGLITDFMGFILILPPTRYPIRKIVRKWLEAHFYNPNPTNDEEYIIDEMGNMKGYFRWYR